MACMTQPKLPPLPEIEKRIGIKAPKWKARCYEIAQEFVKAKVVKGAAVYGHWTGPIARTSFFADRRRLGFVHHGWVLCKDGWVVDPTRWVFEDIAPYVYVGRKSDLQDECPDFEPSDDVAELCRHCGCQVDEHATGFFRPCLRCGPQWPYDEGGNQFRSALATPPPRFSPLAKRVDMGFHDMLYQASLYAAATLSKQDNDEARHAGDAMATAAGCSAHIVRLLGPDNICQEDADCITQDQALWLANLPYDALGAYAWPIYKALERAGARSFVPIDNWIRAQREHSNG